MALGLFDRQAPIGLDIPEWVTLYVAPCHSPDWILIEEIAEGIATIGSRGMTIVLGGHRAGWDTIGNSNPHVRIRDRIAAYRPWFNIVLCNESYFVEYQSDLAAGRGFILREAVAGPFTSIPSAIVGDWAVVLDIKTTLVGKSSDPVAMLAEVDSNEVEHPFTLPHWQDRWDEQTLTSTSVLLAINYLAKPTVHQTNTFVFAAEFIDQLTADAFNDRGLRPRWQTPDRVPAT
jgi:hypothetical protein